MSCLTLTTSGGVSEYTRRKLSSCSLTSLRRLSVSASSLHYKDGDTLWVKLLVADTGGEVGASPTPRCIVRASLTTPDLGTNSVSFISRSSQPLLIG
jgi:hypothetical protein